MAMSPWLQSLEAPCGLCGTIESSPRAAGEDVTTGEGDTSTPGTTISTLLDVSKHSKTEETQVLSSFTNLKAAMIGKETAADPENVPKNVPKVPKVPDVSVTSQQTWDRNSGNAKCRQKWCLSHTQDDGQEVVGVYD